jgi:integrase
VTKTYQVFGKIMAAAVDAGYLAQTPCRNVPLPKIEREEMRFLTPAEIITLADAIRPLYRTLVLVGAYGGLRIGELAGLRRGRVDLLRGTVTVAEIVTEVEGKLFFGLPKTRAGRRTVGLPRFVARELEAHLADPGDPERPCLHRPERGTAAGDGLPSASLAAGDQGGGPGGAAHPRPATHRRGALDRRRCEPQGGCRPGRSHVGQLHPRPLRPPVSGLLGHAA